MTNAFNRFIDRLDTAKESGTVKMSPWKLLKLKYKRKNRMKWTNYPKDMNQC